MDRRGWDSGRDASPRVEEVLRLSSELHGKPVRAEDGMVHDAQNRGILVKDMLFIHFVHACDRLLIQSLLRFIHLLLRTDSV